MVNKALSILLEKLDKNLTLKQTKGKTKQLMRRLLIGLLINLCFFVSPFISSASVSNSVTIISNTGQNSQNSDINTSTGDVSTSVSITNQADDSETEINISNQQETTIQKSTETSNITNKNQTDEYVHIKTIENGRLQIETTSSNEEKQIKILDQSETYSIDLGENSRLEVSYSNEGYRLSHGNQKIISTYPLKIDSQSNQIYIQNQTESHLKHLPQTVFDYLTNQGFEVNNLNLEEKQNIIVYQAKTSSLIRLLGLIPLKIPATITVPVNASEISYQLEHPEWAEILNKLSW